MGNQCGHDVKIALVFQKVLGNQWRHEVKATLDYAGSQDCKVLWSRGVPVLKNCCGWEVIAYEKLRKGSHDHIGLRSTEVQINHCGNKVKASLFCIPQGSWETIVSRKSWLFRSVVHMGLQQLLWKGNKGYNGQWSMALEKTLLLEIKVYVIYRDPENCCSKKGYMDCA